MLRDVPGEFCAIFGCQSRDPDTTRCPRSDRIPLCFAPATPVPCAGTSRASLDAVLASYGAVMPVALSHRAIASVLSVNKLPSCECVHFSFHDSLLVSRGLRIAVLMFGSTLR